MHLVWSLLLWTFPLPKATVTGGRLQCTEPAACPAGKHHFQYCSLSAVRILLSAFMSFLDCSFPGHKNHLFAPVGEDKFWKANQKQPDFFRAAHTQQQVDRSDRSQGALQWLEIIHRQECGKMTQEQSRASSECLGGKRQSPSGQAFENHLKQAPYSGCSWARVNI